MIKFKMSELFKIKLIIGKKWISNAIVQPLVYCQGGQAWQASSLTAILLLF
jgi:hypothetical protein